MQFIHVRFLCILYQDELEEIAAAHEEGLMEEESDDEELTEEERKRREDARVAEDMADMGFD